MRKLRSHSKRGTEDAFVPGLADSCGCQIVSPFPQLLCPGCQECSRGEDQGTEIKGKVLTPLEFMFRLGAWEIDKKSIISECPVTVQSLLAPSHSP